VSDLEQIKTILTEAKIEFEEESDKDAFLLSVHRGYNGFVTIFTFDQSGKLKDMGAYE